MDFNRFLFKHCVYYPATFLRGQNVLGTLKHLQQSQYWPSERLRRHQVGRLNSLLQYAGENVPYYRSCLSKGPKRLSSLKDITTLPFLTKNELRDAEGLMRATRLPWLPVKKTTGGSTGQPLTILKSRESMANELAATWRGYSWAGIDIGDRQARFWGVPLSHTGRRRAQLIDFICNRLRCSAFDFDDTSLERYEQRLVRFRPTYFYGYVSMLTAFADYFVSKGRPSPFAPELKCIITTSEVLTDAARHHLETVFHARVFNEYGCGEVGTIAHECEHGSLHINEENLIVEVLNGDRPCQPGEMGELVVTELNNTLMPLLRYRMGDFGSLGSAPCKCGRNLAILQHIHGRAYDFVVTPDGRRFHGEIIMYVFEEAKAQGMPLGQFQVIQRSIDDFLVKIVPASGFDQKTHTAAIAKRMRQFLGEGITVDFEMCASISREQSGKMRVIVGLTSAHE